MCLDRAEPINDVDVVNAFKVMAIELHVDNSIAVPVKYYRPVFAAARGNDKRRLAQGCTYVKTGEEDSFGWHGFLNLDSCDKMFAEWAGHKRNPNGYVWNLGRGVHKFNLCVVAVQLSGRLNKETGDYAFFHDAVRGDKMKILAEIKRYA